MVKVFIKLILAKLNYAFFRIFVQAIMSLINIQRLTVVNSCRFQLSKPLFIGALFILKPYLLSNG